MPSGCFSCCGIKKTKSVFVRKPTKGAWGRLLFQVISHVDSRQHRKHDKENLGFWFSEGFFFFFNVGNEMSSKGHVSGHIDLLPESQSHRGGECTLVVSSRQKSQSAGSSRFLHVTRAGKGTNWQKRRAQSGGKAERPPSPPFSFCQHLGHLRVSAGKATRPNSHRFLFAVSQSCLTPRKAVTFPDKPSGRRPAPTWQESQVFIGGERGRNDAQLPD
jgi:hypothetical protein